MNETAQAPQPAAGSAGGAAGALDETPPFGTYHLPGTVQWIIERTQAFPVETWSARRLAVLLRNVAMRLLPGGPFDVERLGIRLRLHPYNNICEKKVLFTPQFFDPQELAALRARMKDGFTFVDVGANVGVYALFVASEAGPTARVLAVEPQPAIFDRLIYNISQNPFGTIKAVACAVADKPGELTLFLDPKNSGESSVKIIGQSDADSVRVPATTLLDLVRSEGFAHVDAVKLDVEGAEDIILEPFFRDAPTSLHPSLLIVENGLDRWQVDLPALLEGQGYRLVEETRLNLIYERA